MNLLNALRIVIFAVSMTVLSAFSFLGFTLGGIMEPAFYLYAAVVAAIGAAVITHILCNTETVRLGLAPQSAPLTFHTDEEWRAERYAQYKADSEKTATWVNAR